MPKPVLKKIGERKVLSMERGSMMAIVELMRRIERE